MRSPVNETREYQALLLRYVRVTHIIFRETLRNTIKQNKTRFDDEILDTLMFDAYGNSKKKAEQLTFDFSVLNKLALGVDKANSRALRRIIGVSILETPARDALMEQWAADNVALITSIQPLYFEQMKDTILLGLKNGVRPEAMIKDIEHRFSVTRNRAKLIARDQMASLNGKLTEHQQTSVGIGEYIWTSARDGDRVRPLHQDLDGTVMSWNSPHPTEGHPGFAINCRCFAKPVMPANNK